MATFSVGQHIRYLPSATQSISLYGKSWTLEQNEEFVIKGTFYVRIKDKEILCYKFDCVKCSGIRELDLYAPVEVIDAHCVSLTPPTPISMSVLSSARKLFLSANERKLQKSGLKDADGNWNSDARAAFLENLMNADALAADSKLLKMADDLIAEKKDEPACKC